MLLRSIRYLHEDYPNIMKDKTTIKLITKNREKLTHRFANQCSNHEVHIMEEIGEMIILMGRIESFYYPWILKKKQN